jgi:hypothetical protein
MILYHSLHQNDCQLIKDYEFEKYVSSRHRNILLNRVDWWPLRYKYKEVFILNMILIQQMPVGPDLQVNINIVRKCQQKRYNLSPI